MTLEPYSLPLVSMHYTKFRDRVNAAMNNAQGSAARNMGDRAGNLKPMEGLFKMVGILGFLCNKNNAND